MYTPYVSYIKFSFDDNKVLKVQLDMLFVQVYKTID